MANISDIIEEFILKTLGDDDFVDISRNELASFFACANSQINYVLDTRFTMDKGFLKESHRGGGGYIRICRLKIDDNNVGSLILESVGESLTYKRAEQIMERLIFEKIISLKEAKLVLAGLSDKALTMPVSLKEQVRASAFKCVLAELLKSSEEDN